MRTLLLAFLTCNFANAGEFDHLIKRSWKTSIPSVIVCQDTTDLNSVTSAVNFWRQQGFVIKSPVIKSNCKNSVDIDTIKFIKHRKGDGLLDNENGFTDRRFDGDYMFGANIIIKPEYYNTEELLKHELGHALGLNHSTEPSNIMYHERKY